MYFATKRRSMQEAPQHSWVSSRTMDEMGRLFPGILGVGCASGLGDDIVLGAGLTAVLYGQRGWSGSH